MVATKNNRTTLTTFSMKDVLVVVAAMLTAIAPLIANESKFEALQKDVDAAQAHTLEVEKRIFSNSESSILTKLQLQNLSDRTQENDVRIRTQELEIAALKERVKALEARKGR